MPATLASRLRSTGTVPVQRARESSGYWSSTSSVSRFSCPLALPVPAHSYEPHPYTVAEQNFTIQRLQVKADNRHAVFLTHARESLAYHYERVPDDPRVT